ncbi:AfsR/SARP family transcriptional regulator [Nocardiopsis sp. MG754419]|uniref:AfsR/SARP family transcriptional regulator n=1 Tax=Nocardiopsis sp. MG754419 TaxID=2259865 RepID=UPI001BA5B3EB|nr:AfsR/SARP family transcriptional regulator [Nocardiopsis sp. MG754419]MBR8741939.1 SARP family transcriptional regulator [Nocardiopsis sp. MG754419]
MTVRFGVLGPVQAWDARGRPLPLKGPRHRAVLARLILAQGRVVPVRVLVDDLWEDDVPPAGAVAAVRTFVAALRRALEPDRAPRTTPRILLTQGTGYALRTHTVDAREFEDALTAAASSIDTDPARSAALLDEALDLWRGPAYTDVAHTTWARAERARLGERRLGAVEARARAHLATGDTGRVIADLDAHVTDHPWREEAWHTLALALYRAGRQGEALDVLRRARTLLADRLGLDPGPSLRRLEHDILHQADHVEAPTATVDRLWHSTADAYRSGPGPRARLESTVGLLRALAVTGPEGLTRARTHRMEAVDAARALGDPDLTARVIGAYDVPANWTHSDDPAQAARVVAAAEETLTALGHQGHHALRARLLSTVALESRGDRSERPRLAALEAEHLARGLGDPTLLAFALNGRWMQTFHRTGLADERGRIGTELVELSARQGLDTFEILGHLIGVQTGAAVGDTDRADHHADAVARLARRHERPLVEVFTTWYRALRLDLTGRAPAEVAEAYRAAADRTIPAGMPGLAQGLLPLALLSLRLRHGSPWREEPDTDWGPHAPWVAPLRLLSLDRPDEASRALDRVQDPAPGLVMEAHWALVAHAALALGHRPALRRARAALTPALGEHAGAAGGMFTLGPVADLLRRIDGAG